MIALVRGHARGTWKSGACDGDGGAGGRPKPSVAPETQSQIALAFTHSSARLCLPTARTVSSCTACCRGGGPRCPRRSARQPATRCSDSSTHGMGVSGTSSSSDAGSPAEALMCPCIVRRLPSPSSSLGVGPLPRPPRVFTTRLAPLPLAGQMLASRSWWLGVQSRPLAAALRGMRRAWWALRGATALGLLCAALGTDLGRSLHGERLRLVVQRQALSAVASAPFACGCGHTRLLSALARDYRSGMGL